MAIFPLPIVAAECICAIPLALYFEVKCKLTCQYTCNLHVSERQMCGWFPFAPDPIPALLPCVLEHYFLGVGQAHLSSDFCLGLTNENHQQRTAASVGEDLRYLLPATPVTPWIGSVLVWRWLHIYPSRLGEGTSSPPLGVLLFP